MSRQDPSRHLLPPDPPDNTESLLPGEGSTPFERAVNLVVAAVLVALGLYALFGPV